MTFAVGGLKIYNIYWMPPSLTSEVSKGFDPLFFYVSNGLLFRSEKGLLFSI
jgi:hypothetical protein